MAMIPEHRQKSSIEHSRPWIGDEEKKAVLAVLDRNFLAEGAQVSRFEAAIADYTGAKGAVATSTGTLALELALLSLDLSRKNQVIIPSYTCRSVLNAVLTAGAKPVVCDVESGDYNLSARLAAPKVSRRTAAIIIPHMFGCPAQIDKFRELGVTLIEDCAHSIGAEFKGRKAGSWGDLAIFSFEGTKYITTGEGGAVAANSPALLKKLRKLKEPDSADYRIKYTFRMTDMQAAVGLAQLAKLAKFISLRRKIAGLYTREFKGTGLELPVEPLSAKHIFHRYMVKVPGGADRFMERCLAKKVKVKRPVKPWPVHKYIRLPDRDYPNTGSIMRNAASIPIYPSLDEREAALVVSVVKKACLGL